MSVDCITYLMWAVNLDVEIDVDDFEDELDEGEGHRFDLVDDTMCGEYTLFGHIISKLWKGNGYADRETFSPTKVTFIDMD